MQPFYLSKNQSGYFKVYFVNTETGKVIRTKSTHSKNKFEANMLASKWACEGLPEKRTSPSLAFNTQTTEFSGLDLNFVANKVTQNEALKLIDLLNSRFNFGQTQEAAASLISSPVPMINNPAIKTEPTTSDTTEPVYLIETLMNFWDFENSEYVKKRVARGYDIKQRNCKEKLGIVKKILG